MSSIQNWLARLQFARLLKLMIVAGVLALAVALGYKASMRVMMFLLAGTVGLIIATVLVRNLYLGVLFLLPISFFVRYTIGTGTQTGINMTVVWIALMLGVWLVRMFVIERQVRLLSSRVVMPAVLFMVSATLSLIAGSIRWVPQALQGASLFAQLGGWMLYVFPVALMLMVGNVFLTRRGLQTLVLLFLGLGAVYLPFRLLASQEWVWRLFTGGGQNPIFYTWLAALAFGQFLFNRDLKVRIRILVGLLVVFSIAGMYVNQRSWLSGWLPAVLAVGALVWLRSWRWGLLLTLAAAIFLFGVYPELVDQIIYGDNDYSVMTRLATWPIMFELVKASPILGLGPSNYYHYTPVYLILGYQVKFNSHNNYWDLAASVGLLGLGLFLWLAFEIVRFGWQMRGRARDGFEHGFINGILAGTLATLAVGMLADWFMPFVYNIGFTGFRSAVYAWLFIGGLMGLEQVIRKESVTEAQPGVGT